MTFVKSISREEKQNDSVVESDLENYDRYLAVMLVKVTEWR